MRFEREAPLLFTENETNHNRIFGSPNGGPYLKDAFHDYVIGGRQEVINPARVGTKAAAHYQQLIEPRQAAVIRLRLTRGDVASVSPMSAKAFDAVLADRLAATSARSPRP